MLIMRIMLIVKDIISLIIYVEIFVLFCLLLYRKFCFVFIEEK